MHLIWATEHECVAEYQKSVREGLAHADHLSPELVPILHALRAVRRFLTKYVTRPLRVEAALRSGPIPRSQLEELLCYQYNGSFMRKIPDEGQSPQEPSLSPTDDWEKLDRFRTILVIRDDTKMREYLWAPIVRPNDRNKQVNIVRAGLIGSSRTGAYFPSVLYRMLPSEIVMDRSLDWSSIRQMTDLAKVMEKVMDETSGADIRCFIGLKRKPSVASVIVSVERTDYSKLVKTIAAAEKILEQEGR